MKRIVEETVVFDTTRGLELHLGARSIDLVDVPAGRVLMLVEALDDATFSDVETLEELAEACTAAAEELRQRLESEGVA